MEKESQKTILIVDDEPHITLSMEYLFEDEGCNVIKADNSEDAVNMIKDKKPDLVILDIMMPRSKETAGNIIRDEGVRICKEIKANDDKSISGIPIILLSVKAKSIDVPDDLGAEKVFVKPFNSEALISCVKEILESKKENRS